jgi:hypothetical protein
LIANLSFSRVLIQTIEIPAIPIPVGMPLISSEDKDVREFLWRTDPALLLTLKMGMNVLTSVIELSYDIHDGLIPPFRIYSTTDDFLLGLLGKQIPRCGHLCLAIDENNLNTQIDILIVLLSLGL